jgi:hypothetical protein
MRRSNERRAAKEARRSQVRSRTLAIGATVALGATVFYVPPAEASSFQVTNKLDDGAGSLRAALEQADASDGHDVITFAPSVTGTIELTTGQLSAETDVTIAGPGATHLTIDAGGESRVFDLRQGYYSSSEGGAVVISGLTLTGGNADGEGGAVYSNADSITLTDLVVTGNHATGGGGGFGTDNSGPVTITGSTFSGNDSDQLGGAIYIDDAAAFTLTDSIVSGNHADSGGGGVLLYNLYANSDGNGEALVEGSLISGNSTEGDGGGVGIFPGLYDGGEVRFPTTFENTTIAENHADGSGGGVSIADQTDDATQTFTSTTIALNTSPSVGGLAAGSGAKVLRNSIVADNTKRDLRLTSSSEPFSLDFSLVENAGSTPITNLTPGSNVVGADPKLGALADNGGPTKTIAPTTASPVVDQGSSFGLTGDQRGQGRPVDRVGGPTAGDGADMGAVELKAGESPATNPNPEPEPETDAPPVVTNTDDAGAGSLRAAVESAAANPGADVVTFDPSVTGTITLTSGPIVSRDTSAVEIQGPGAEALTIDADGESGIFEFGTRNSSRGRPVTVSGLTLTGGHAQRYVEPYTYEGHDYEGRWEQLEGGAIFARVSSLTLTDLVVTDSQGSQGGGVAADGGDVTVTDSRFTGNAASGVGGGLMVGSARTVEVTGSTFSENTSDHGGGGITISRSRSFTLDQSTVSGNTAGDGGGGLDLAQLTDRYYGGSAVVRDSVISGNSAGGDGGGVGVNPPSYGYDTTSEVRFPTTFENTTIAGNHADGVGGGIYVARQSSDVAQTLTSTTIAGNSASSAGGIAADAGDKILQNTIVADNQNGDLGLVSSTDPFSLDFSLVEHAGTTPVTQVTAGSSILGEDPKLGALTDNGGPTRTMAPGAASPALDAGKGFGIAEDQRGSARPVDLAGVPNAGDASDMGSVENQSGTVTSMAPGAPTDVDVTPGDGQATVSWTAPSSNGGSAITGYKVQVKPVEGGTWTTVQTPGPSATSAVVGGLANGVTYAVRVLAINAIGDGSPSATATVTPGGDSATTPGAPTIGSATPGNAQASVTWSAPADNGGTAITGYQVQVRSGGGSWGTAATAGPSATGAIVTGLTNGTTYSVRVIATNAIGDGSPSATVTVTPAAPVSPPAATAPGAPAIGTATPGNAASTVTWSAPASNGGSAITGYTVQYQVVGAASWTNGPSVAGTVFTATVAGLVNGTTYAFRVVATNAVGAGAPSGTVSARPTAPALPSIPKPKLKGTPKAGKKVSVVLALPAAAAGAKLTYSWVFTPKKKGAKKPKSKVVGKAATLKLGKSWKGGKVTVVVTVTKAGMPPVKVSTTVKIKLPEGLTT